MPNDKESENVMKAIKAIGESRLPLNQALIKDVENKLIKNGYDDAIVFAEQAYLSTDVNAEIVRVLVICRRYGLSQEEAAQVLDYLSLRHSQDD